MYRDIPSFLNAYTGRGVFIAIIDSGLDIFGRAFRKADGSTRVLRFWDQTYQRSFAGKVYEEWELNEILQAGNRYLLTDYSGHGTEVAAIAGGYVPDSLGGGMGWTTEDNSLYTGIAPECSFLVVKLGNARDRDFPKTTQLMRAVSFCLKTAEEFKMPLVINLSFGNCYGNHRGTSLLERYLNNASEIGKTLIVAGSGNEGDSFGHVTLDLKKQNRQSVELSVSAYESSLNVQLWTMWQEDFRFIVREPGGRSIEINLSKEGYLSYRLGDTVLAVWVGVPSPYELEREIYISFIPVGNYIDAGVWSIEIEGIHIVTGLVNLYLPSSKTRNPGTKFLISSPELTLTVPSSAERLLTVGAYDERTRSYAPFSGRGKEGEVNKPELSAAGVEVPTLAPNDVLLKATGTSFSTPRVSGIAALLMEKGIVRGEDPYLYGSKLKAELIRMAKPLPGAMLVPDSRIGYGVV